METIYKTFYSHAPRGARRKRKNPYNGCSEFLLTRPSRGATVEVTATRVKTMISTHTPLAGRDGC